MIFVFSVYYYTNYIGTEYKTCKKTSDKTNTKLSYFFIDKNKTHQINIYGTPLFRFVAM